MSRRTRWPPSWPPNRLVAAVTAALLVIGGTIVAVRAFEGIPGLGFGTDPSTRSSSGSGTYGRRGLWYAIGRTPTEAELDAAPATIGVVILNIWEVAALQRLKQLDPSIIVLAYQDLSSARSYDDGPNPPAGVSWAEVMAHPSWLATDTTGQRIEWSGYPEHWQAAVWDAGYRQTWTANVTRRVIAAGFDGVLADNALSTLKWYSSQLLAGTTSSAQTDIMIRDGVAALVEEAGQALRAKGKLLVPNVSDARLHPGRWAALSRWGGAMEENLAHFGTSRDLSSFVTDWESGGWEEQTTQLFGSGLSLAVTPAATGDARAFLYGYASLLVRGDDSSFWQPSVDAGNYTTQQSIPEQHLPIGRALEAGHQLGNGAWTRRYEKVWVAVNPTVSTVSVAAPAGATDTTGRRRDRDAVQLEPATGVVLRLR
jgi:hypothetical protein